MADLNALTYCRLVGLYNSVVADTVGPYGDDDTRPDIYQPYMDATVTVFVAGHQGQTPELRLENANPPRTVLLAPIDCVVEAGIFRLKSQTNGVNGVDIIAKSQVMGLGDKLLCCRVDFGPTRISGRNFQFDPVTFVLPTVEREDYTAGVHQVIRIVGSPTTGLWRLLYEGSATATLSRTATGSAVQAALRALPAIGNDVNVTGPFTGTDGVPYYDAVFTGSLAADIPSPLSSSDSFDTGSVVVEDTYEPFTLDLSTVDRMDLPPSTPSSLVLRMIPDDVTLVDGEIQFSALGIPIGDPLPVTIAPTAIVGATTNGIDVLTGDAAAGRTALGATAVGAAVFTAADAAAARTAAGATTLGSTLFTAASQAAARKALGPLVFDARDYGVIADTPVLASTATDTITAVGHGLVNGDQVYFHKLGAATNIGLRANYYVVGKTADTFKVALTAGGSPLTLGTATVQYCKYVPHNNVANLLDVMAQCAKGGGTVVLPAGVISTSEAVMRTTVTADSGRQYFNRGALELPYSTPVRVMGQGKGVTTLRFSPGFRRAFDLPWAGFTTLPVFRHIELCDMTIDGQNIGGTTIAPPTAVVTPEGAPTTVTIPGSFRYLPGIPEVVASISDYTNILFYANTQAFPGVSSPGSYATSFPGTGDADHLYVSSATGWPYVWEAGSFKLATYVWVTVPGISGELFRNADTVYLPKTAAGNWKEFLSAGRVNPNNPNEFQIAHSSGSTLRTLINGDTLQGTMTGHIIVGNSQHTDAGRFNGGQGFFMDLDGLYVHDIEAINVHTRTDEFSSWAVVWSDHTYIVGVLGSYNSQTAYTPAISGDLYSSVTNVLVERCEAYGSDFGYCIGGNPQTITNAKRVWSDNIWVIDCFHDVQKDWFLSAAGAYTNFMIGGSGPTGRAGVIRCEGRRSGDTGLEIDNVWQFYDIDNTIIDCRNPILVRAQGIPARTSAGPITTTLSGAIAAAAANSTTSATFLPMDFRITKYPSLFNTRFVEEQGFVMIDSELCWYRVDSVASNGSSVDVTLWRGANGTTPAAHAANAKVWFFENHKQQVISTGHRVEFGASWAANPPLQLSGFMDNLPAPSWSVRDGLYTYHSGFGLLAAVGGHTANFDMQDCRFVAGRVSINTDMPVSSVDLTHQAVVSAFSKTADMHDAGVPIPPTRIYGRGNVIQVRGDFKDSPNRYFSSFGPVGGYYSVDWEADASIEISRVGMTGSGYTSAVRLNPTGTDCPVTGTKKLILAPGSRVRVNARIPTGSNYDSAPVSAYIGSSTVVAGSASVEVHDVLGTLTPSVDAAAATTILVGTPSTHAAAAKTVPAGADEIAILDSADRYSLKKLTWSQILAGARADIPISGIAATGSPSSGTFLRGDGVWEVGVAGPMGPQGPAGSSGTVDGGNAASPGPVTLDGGTAASNT